MNVDLSKVAYIVPNIPRFEINENLLWNWWDNVNVPVERIQVDSRGHGQGFDGEFWNGITIWNQPTYQDNFAWKITYCPNKDLFGDLIDKVIKNLPWFNILGITLWSHKKSIPPHKDGFPIDPFPSAPRILLTDNCEKDTFYLLDRPSLKIFKPDLKLKSNLFFFNNQNFEHGALRARSGRKILVRIDGPLIDPKGLLEFINTQIELGAKYEGIN
jgi:hypothetical protein